MKRFIFTMDNVLNIREKLEEKKKQEYGKALNKLQNEIEKKENLIKETNTFLQILSNKIEEKIHSNEVILCNQYINYLKEKIDDQEKIVQDAEQYAQKKQEELLEAVKKKKMLETLKEKRLIEFLQEMNRKEQIINDEIVNFKYQAHLKDGGDEDGKIG
ncbi:flagellar export protein FliJ [Defluviitalea phaphyphila]|uniref:flagellar export protein FliJ n=1 Tax=Defluviitalea phaphyphila TaxID=1473580 RepID=UPI0007307B9C|nr:flagellar export protein FliJ [Defluviitalea phaphyphila]